MFITQKNKDNAEEIFDRLQAIHHSQFENREQYNQESKRMIAATLAEIEDKGKVV